MNLLPNSVEPRLHVVGTESQGTQKAHLRIAAAIEQEVREALLPHDCIPPERELVERFGVSRTTVRNAIDTLVQRGLLYKIPKSGTYVSEPGPTMSPLTISSISESMGGFAQDTRIEVTEILIGEARGNAEITEVLNLRPSDLTITIRRRRYIDDKIVAFECSVFPYGLVPGIEKEQLDGPLYELLKTKWGLQVERLRQKVRATALRGRYAESLHAETGLPALHVERIGYTRSGIPLERSIFIYPGEKPAIEVNIIGNQD
ncbi:GntR family transcriptional regulator [Schaalia sp. lx-260]|uniref:GntR family transcriptional regulator n=1 Tax=Schaalia sp. lx-260 TaxID=2899082 RepID=UPI001E52E059|nr:GntR family transcriptional regulator [Schaalia sp. lx-260]MCD4550348.1 GntR family transcriptional regulator [Schaalia sp. lx-260]